MNRYDGYMAAWASHWKVRYPKVVDAVVSGNWDVLMEILSTSFYDQPKKVEDYFFWQAVLHEAMCCARCDVMEFIVRKGCSHGDLDQLLSNAASSGNFSLEVVDRLCWLGAGEITDYWNSCFSLKNQVAIYGILLEHNVVSPRMLFCVEGDMVDPQQPSLIFWLNIPRDCCRAGCARVDMFEGWKPWVLGMVCGNEDVLGLTKLHARNGPPITVQTPLLEVLPQAKPTSRVSEIMAAALQPASLQSLCRQAVRETGPKRGFKSWVQKLGLPEKMSTYLCSIMA